VPEDRKADGCVGTFSVAENLILNHYDEPPYARGIAMDLSKVRENATHRVAEFDIRTQSIEATVSSLSGATSKRWSWPVSCLGHWGSLSRPNPLEALMSGQLSSSTRG
jgi:ABC-type sugar transport system ATPase subunit